MRYWITVYIYLAALICSVSKAAEEKVKVFHTDESRIDFTNLLSSLVKLNERRIKSFNDMNGLQDYGAIRQYLRTPDINSKRHKRRNLLIFVISNTKSVNSRRRVTVADEYYDNVIEQNLRDESRNPHIIPEKGIEKQLRMMQPPPIVINYHYPVTENLRYRLPTEEVNVLSKEKVIKENIYSRRVGVQPQRHQRQRVSTTRIIEDETINFGERDSLSDDYPIINPSNQPILTQREIEKARAIKNIPTQIKDDIEDKPIGNINNNHIQELKKRKMKHQNSGKVNGVYSQQFNKLVKSPNINIPTVETDYTHHTIKPVIPMVDLNFSPAPQKINNHKQGLPETMIHIPIPQFTNIDSEDTWKNNQLIPTEPHRFSVQPNTAMSEIPINHNSFRYQMKEPVPTFDNQPMIHGAPAPEPYTNYPSNYPLQEHSITMIQDSRMNYNEKHVPSENYPEKQLTAKKPMIQGTPRHPLHSETYNPRQEHDTTARQKKSVLKIEMGLHNKHNDNDQHEDKGIAEYIVSVADKNDKRKRKESGSDSSKIEFQMTDSENDHSYKLKHDSLGIKNMLRQGTFRKSWQSCLGKKAFKKCKTACSNAYKKVCRQLKCTSKSRKDLKKECVRSCKNGFVGKKSHKHSGSGKSGSGSGSAGGSGSGSD